jgi:hypothetical protein
VLFLFARRFFYRVTRFGKIVVKPVEVNQCPKDVGHAVAHGRPKDVCRRIAV